MTEFEKARRELFDAVCDALYIPQLVDWLNRKLTR